MQYIKYVSILLLSIVTVHPGLALFETEAKNVKYFTNKTGKPIWVYLIDLPLISEVPEWTEWAPEATREKIETKFAQIQEYAGYVPAGKRVGIQFIHDVDEVVILKEGAERPSKDALKAGLYDKKKVFYTNLSKYRGPQEFTIYPGANGELLLQAEIKKSGIVDIPLIEDII